jgi:hypothetical protein
MPVDFFARHEHYIDHMLPVWNALEGARGSFYLPESLAEIAEQKEVKDAVFLKPRDESPISVSPDGLSPLVISAYGDMSITYRRTPQRPFIRMDHGVGFTFNGHKGYVAGNGLMSRVKLFLAQSEYVRAKAAARNPKMPQVVIGTPKLDEWADRARVAHHGKPIVVISFHWNGEKVTPEAGTAFAHYRSILPELARQTDFTVVGHGHPKFRAVLEAEYEAHGIETIWDFAEVMRIADVYVNDCSSTLYEFCVTGKPVVVLNAPWFRREIKGDIRFWDYADVGPQVDEPHQLLDGIRVALGSQKSGKPEDVFCHHAARQKAVADLYPFLGSSAQRAAGAILGFLGGKR